MDLEFKPRRELSRRRWDRHFSVWQTTIEEGSSLWVLVGVFSEREEAEHCLRHGPGWPHHRVSARRDDVAHPRAQGV